MASLPPFFARLRVGDVGACGSCTRSPARRSRCASAPRRRRRRSCFGEHVGVARQVGATAPPPNQPPSLRTDAVRAGLPTAGGIALAEQRLHRRCGCWPRSPRAPCRSSPRRRAGSPTGRPDTRPRDRPRGRPAASRSSSAKPVGEIGHAEAGDADRLVGMVAARFHTTGLPQSWPTHTALLAAERRQQLEHVLRRSAPARSPRGACRCSSGRSRACPARRSGSRAPRTPATGGARTARARASRGRRSAAAPSSAPQAR